MYAHRARKASWKTTAKVKPGVKHGAEQGAEQTAWQKIVREYESMEHTHKLQPPPQQQPAGPSDWPDSPLAESHPIVQPSARLGAWAR